MYRVVAVIISISEKSVRSVYKTVQFYESDIFYDSGCNMVEIGEARRLVSPH